ncbi:MAG: right-handed parallel beta-helix repeat-containing protein [Fibrobacteres bacterium]|nr:right-handed parallel beta-helix repeat-containing protein [Fibrobacterota bacterium]
MHAKSMYNLKIAIVLLLVLLGSAQATNYYFKRSTGSNTTTGLDTLHPWASTQALKGKVILLPGDSLLFRRGETFANETLFLARHIKTQGTGAKPIVIGAWGSGTAKPILTSSNGRLMVLEKVTNVFIENLALSGARYGCIEMADSLPSNIRVQNNDLSKCGGGVYASGTQITISNNTIHDMKMVVNTKGAAGTNAANDDYGASGIGLSRINGCTVTGNNLWNLKAPSYDYGDDGGAFELWGTVRNCEVYRNKIRTTSGLLEAGGQAGDSVTNFKFHHNIAFETGAFFCLHIRSPRTSYGIYYRDIAFDHNLSINHKRNPGFHLLTTGDTLSDPKILQVRNNIFLSDSLESYVYQEGLSSTKKMPGTFMNNLLWCVSKPDISKRLQSTSEKFGNPLFAISDWYKADTLTDNIAAYRPQATSPLVGAGIVLKNVPTSYSYDFAWQPAVTSESTEIGPLNVMPVKKAELAGRLSESSQALFTVKRNLGDLQVVTQQASGYDIHYRVVGMDGRTIAGPGTWSGREGANTWTLPLPKATGMSVLMLNGPEIGSQTISIPNLK